MTRAVSWPRPAPALLAALAVAAPALAACGDNDPGDTIADVVRRTPELSTLAGVLDEAGLMETLDREGSLTLFAPTDEAVARFLATQGRDLPDLLAAPELRDLLRHHLIETAVDGEALAAARELTTAWGGAILVDTDPLGVELDSDTRLVGEPLPASNGVVHRVDAVLARPTVSTHASAAPRRLDTFNQDVLLVDAPGFVRGVEVEVELDAARVFGTYLFLVHEASGTTVRLVGAPDTLNAGIETTFSDRALLDVVDDLPFGEGGGPAFPAPRYRPHEPLRYFYGLPAASEWSLYVYHFSGGGPSPEPDTLQRWTLRLVTTAERPDPTFAMARPRGVSAVVAHPVRSTLPVAVKRLAGMTEPITVTLAADGLEATPVVIAGDAEIAHVPFAATGPELGETQVRVDAAASRRQRRVELGGERVTADAQGTELLAQLPLAELGAAGGSGNDVWGWTDPLTGAEYAIMGTSAGTAFVDVSTPTRPRVVGVLPTHTEHSMWRDMKVYRDHAYIVSEAAGHGVQVFDLTRLRGVTTPMTFTATAHHGGVGHAHNIVIDEASGFAYVVGAVDGGPQLCNGGLYMLDLAVPAAPTFAGCFAGGVPAGASPGPAFPTDVYTHDAQCVVYAGPDVEHQGKQICFTSDGDDVSLGIADVTDKATPVQLGRFTYLGNGYSHQGWLTEDHQFFLLNDEFDELDGVDATRTYVFDVRDLDAPVLHGTFDNPRDAVGHNAYVHEGLLYQANYTSGLRVVDLAGIATMALAEVAYYDTYPDDDRADTPGQRCGRRGDASAGGWFAAAGPRPHPGAGRACGVATYAGAWSTYPFFASGTILVSDMQRGLFLVRRTP
ncbi:MAG: choice-of-anchor B family protein [Kofleriaceae bacterium]|nr:choice-of-anchor B family protein [Kofleriaceae bacterium]MCL4224995.1 choice-of-anchor B family protein [Myxococcales bacterium]